MRTLHTPGVSFEWQDASRPLIGPLRTDIAGFVGIAQRGPLHTAVKLQSTTQFASVFGGKIAQGYLAYAVEGFFANGGDTCWVVRVADPDRAEVASLDIVDAGGARIFGIKAGSPGSWGNAIVARWMSRGDTVTSLTLDFPDGTQQLIRNPLDNALPAVTNDIELLSASLPALFWSPAIRLEKPDRSPPASYRAPVNGGGGVLGGGSDGLATLTPAHVSGEDAPLGRVWGIAALEAVAEIAIVAAPDIMPKPRFVPHPAPQPKPDCSKLDPPPPIIAIEPVAPERAPSFSDDEIATLQHALLRHCEKLRYRVAILDTQDGLLPTDAIAARKPFAYSDRAALYYPWIQVDDALRLDGPVRAVPPSGWIAGVYAKRDRRDGVHQPPANEVLAGALDVRFAVDPILHGDLNDANVNVIRPFAGRGIRVYGARTVSENTLWTYVNVRRLLLMIEKAIEQNSQWLVFERNDRSLRREIDRICRSYLESLFRAGFLDGADSDSAYFVACDDALNPPEIVDAGRVICRIGVQPPYPAEFVIVMIGKTQNAVDVLSESGSTGA
jgi:hypothetical protein